MFAQAAGGKIEPSTLAAITAGKKASGADVSVLLTGNFGGNDEAAKLLASVEGVAKVLVADSPSLDHDMPEKVAPVLLKAQEVSGATHVLAGSTTVGKNILPRIAAKLDVSPISEISDVVDENTFVRPIYAGNAMATVQSSDSVKIITVRGTSFEKAPTGGNSAPVETLSDLPESSSSAEWTSDELKESSRPELTSARVVVSGGRGLKSGENFKLLEDLADQLDAGIGASRAAVDAGMCPNDYQIGQTGKTVAPELYIAVGISGAIQHLAGMKDSKVIAAINKDGDAPIFQVSDVGIVADLFKAVPELTEEIKKAKSA